MSTPGTWINELLELSAENMMTQWMTTSTKYRGTDEPSRFDLVFTREADEIDDIKHKIRWVKVIIFFFEMDI